MMTLETTRPDPSPMEVRQEVAVKPISGQPAHLGLSHQKRQDLLENIIIGFQNERL